MSVQIDRCVCIGQSFAALAADARPAGLSADQLMTQSGAGACCGMCRPYLRRMLRTGQTVFHELLDDADEPADKPDARITNGPGGR